MKRLLLFSSLLLIGSFILVAQSLVLSDNTGPLAPDAVVTFTGDENTYEIISPLSVTNISNDTLHVLCKKVEISLVPGSTNMFCWTQCYGPGTYVSPESLKFSPGQKDSLSFYGEYYANGNLGTSRIAYVFFDQNNPDDSVRVFIDYVVQAAGIAELFASGQYYISAPYPNPAIKNSTLSYRLPEQAASTLSVFDLLGNQVARYDLVDKSGTIRFDHDTWANGMYFFSLTVDGKLISTKKLIVKH